MIQYTTPITNAINALRSARDAGILAHRIYFTSMLKEAAEQIEGLRSEIEIEDLAKETKLLGQDLEDLASLHKHPK